MPSAAEIYLERIWQAMFGTTPNHLQVDVLTWPTGGVSLPFTPVGAHVQNASISADTHITVPVGANQMMVQALTKDVNYTLDGSDASATFGFTLTAGAAPIIIPVYAGQVIHVMQVAATATLKYQFGGY
jgi:hypothetical protein